MRLSGYQPQYFPRLHYFNRLFNSDIFEISDYIQFVKKHAYEQADGSLKRGKSFQAHSPIKLSTGLFNLAIPVPDDILPINKIRLNYSSDWPHKHLKTIETAYSRSINFTRFLPDIYRILENKWDNLAHLNCQTIYWSIFRFLSDDKFDLLNLDSLNTILKKQRIFKLTKVFLVSESGISAPKKGGANQWIVDLCRYFGASEYFYGGTSKDAYMDSGLFEKNKIKTLLQDWHCPKYHQMYPKAGFIANLSILDLIMNEPLASRQQIIK